MKLSLQNRSVRTLRAFFSLVFFIFLLVSVINALNILYFYPMSNDQCAWRMIPKRNDAYLITDVVPGGVSDKAGIKDGDVLLKINGKSFTTYTPDQAMSIVNAIPRGDSATYLISRDGSVFETKVEMLKVFNIVFLADLLFALGFAFVGFIVVFTNPKGIVQRAFAYLSLWVILIFGLTALYAQDQPAWWVRTLFGFVLLARIFAPAVYINFFLKFPVQSHLNARRTFITIVLISVLAYLLLSINVLTQRLPQWLLIVLMNFAALFFVAGLIIFTYNYFKYVEKARRKQLRPILFSYVIGVAAFAFIFYLNFTNPYLIFIKPSMLIPSLLVLLLPLSFGYSIFKYRLMDTHFIIKKSIIYGIITTMIALIYLILVFGAGTLLKTVFGQTENQALTIIALIIIAFIFDPLKRRVQEWVDRIFYRERYNYQKALLDFSRKLPMQLNVNQIVGSVINTISSTMHIDRIAGVLLEASNGNACFARNIPEELCRYDQDPGGLLSILKDKKEPLNTSLLVDERYLYNISDYEIDKIKRSGIEVIVPMIAKNNVIGFINTGPKLSEKVYSQEDIDLLTTVAGQAAIAIENARLYEKEKTLYKVESEIKLASKIQTEWLPKASPLIEGFEVSGMSMPAEVVGGDYFDYIDLGGNNISFVIGDVSGKGLPAALLMANARAILRSQALTHVDTITCVKHTNRQIYISSTDDMFVTLFFSMLDVKSKTLYYTNAGHNFPIVFSGGSKTRELSEGGLPLGVEKDSGYKSGKLKMRKDDILLIYTDGITEAFNDSGEMFGEERLYNCVWNNMIKPASVIIDSILKEVQFFKAGAPVNDDMTLIVLKCLS
jgi:sigma-B regulation protein RsbU (phosphoserine phosphatase)